MGYARNLFDLGEGSKMLALRGAFYLGEAFRVSHPRSSWAVGRAETAPRGQSVVTSFKFSMEMPVLLVSGNLFARDRGLGSEDLMAAQACYGAKASKANDQHIRTGVS